MDAASGLDPIDLQIPRGILVMRIWSLVFAAPVLWIAGLARGDKLRVELLMLAVFWSIGGAATVISWVVTGDAGRWLRLDDEGITLRGHRIPWEAVMSARWAFDAAGARHRGGIELFLRGVGAYEPPRSGRVSIDPELSSASARTCYST